jgi:hypothetical protein
MSDIIRSSRCSLPSMLQIRHKICNCMTDDGSSSFGKPIRCFKTEADAKAEVGSQSDKEARPCIADCGHWHVYTKLYLQRTAILHEINRLGTEKALQALKSVLDSLPHGEYGSDNTL